MCERQFDEVMVQSDWLTLGPGCGRDQGNMCSGQDSTKQMEIRGMPQIGWLVLNENMTGLGSGTHGKTRRPGRDCHGGKHRTQYSNPRSQGRAVLSGRGAFCPRGKLLTAGVGCGLRYPHPTSECLGSSPGSSASDPASC